MASNKKEPAAASVTPVTPKATAAFSKQKVLTLNRYAGRRDLLSALLQDGKTYTLDQVDGLIQNFMTKGKVN